VRSAAKASVTAVALLAALLPVGCSDRDRGPEAGETPSAAGSAARPPLCTRLRARVSGRVSARAVTELSGLVLSRLQARVAWAHNDSGDRARLFAIAPSGRLLADLTVPGAEHIDWEDVALGRAPGPGDALYVGDIGDNLAARSAIVVYRLPEPRVLGRAPSATAPAEALTLSYPDGPQDAEALLVDPSSGALLVVTKDFEGTARVYVAERPSPDATTTMRYARKVALGTGEAVTAGDVSANGRTIVLRSYDRAFVWSRRRGESVAAAMRRRPCAARADLAGEGQGEALAVTRDGRSFYTVPEGARPVLRRYAPAG